MFPNSDSAGSGRRVPRLLAKSEEKSLEPNYDLRSNTPRKTRKIICKLVWRRRSQFFQSRRFFLSQAKLRSTTQRWEMTAKMCSSCRFAIWTVAPNLSLTA